MNAGGYLAEAGARYAEAALRLEALRRVPPSSAEAAGAFGEVAALAALGAVAAAIATAMNTAAAAQASAPIRIVSAAPGALRDRP